jgi:predicted 3-demethylubiquinone-9 3-methyltransferase (glyoxalase superfamily)
MATTAPYPCLWCKADPEEAARFYTSLLPNSHIDTVWRTPADTPSGPKGSVLTVVFTLAGQRFMLLAGGPTDFEFNDSISFVMETDDQAETDRLWDTLIANGGEPSYCGWLRDRYGVSWQITPKRLNELTSDPDPERGRRAMEAMLQMRKIDIAELERAADGVTA